jgi:hypothetical protein
VVAYIRRVVAGEGHSPSRNVHGHGVKANDDIHHDEKEGSNCSAGRMGVRNRTHQSGRGSKRYSWKEIHHGTPRGHGNGCRACA